MFRRLLMMLASASLSLGASSLPARADTTTISYNRTAAVNWAMEYAPLNSSNSYEDTCTWFLSLDLLTTGFQPDNQWTWQGSHGWLHPLPGSTTAWVAPQLISYLQTHYTTTYTEISFDNGGYVTAALQPGDIIAYDLGFQPGSGYAFEPDHLAMVVNVIETNSGAYPEVAEWGHDSYYEDYYGNSTGTLADYAKRGWTWSATHRMWLQSWYNDHQYGGSDPYSPNYQSGVSIKAYLLHFNF